MYKVKLRTFIFLFQGEIIEGKWFYRNVMDILVLTIEQFDDLHFAFGKI